MAQSNKGPLGSAGPQCRPLTLPLSDPALLLAAVSFSPLQPLATALHPLGWSLVQAQLSSSYQGFGTGCLDRDAEELLMLLQHLVRADPEVWFNT